MKVNGRPLLNEYQITTLFQKLEPYLMSGLSIRKSCHLAKVPRSTVYCLLDRNKRFLDQITRSRQYVSVLFCTITSKILVDISTKQIDGKDISLVEMDFLQWYATNYVGCMEEYGRKHNSDLYPEREIAKLMSALESINNNYPNNLKRI